MLVLSRNEGESIRLDLPDGRTIIVTYVEYRGRDRCQIRLGVEAPPDVGIWRAEIQERGPKR